MLYKMEHRDVRRGGITLISLAEDWARSVAL
jgi:hypothetical protein